MVELKRIVYIEDPDGGAVNPVYSADETLPTTFNGETKPQPKLSLTITPEKRKFRIVKNLVVLSFGFLILFTAFQSLSNLQSSVNSDQGKGTTSLAIIYGSLVLSCMFVPSIMIKSLGLKTTIIISILMYGLYFLANFYFTWGLLIPASMILGAGGAPLWTAKCAYLTTTANEYADLIGEKVEVIVTWFFGIFFMIFQSGQIWGNLISYFILMPNTNQTVTPEIDLDLLETCGANFCPGLVISNNTNLDRPPESKFQLLCGIYTACAFVAALLIFLCLDPIQKPDKKSADDDSKKSKFSFDLLIDTLRHLRHPHQLLLIPITIFSGMEQAFIIGDFTKAYVTCAWGIHNVGYVMICFGFFDALGSFLFGPIVKKTGRIPVFIFGALGNAAMIILMFLWQPNPEHKMIYFLISGVWGLGDAVWQTQINSFYGILFPGKNEAAFANYRLWESLGFIISFAYSNILCTTVKLYILSATLLVGMSCYFIIEFRERAKKISSYKEKSLPA